MGSRGQGLRQHALQLARSNHFENIKQLKPAWSFSTGTDRGNEAAPLVVGAPMYIVTPYPNIVYALNLSTPGASVKWKYEPKPAAAAQGVACCDVVNRGVAYADGKIVFNTLDVHRSKRTPAKRSGKSNWGKSTRARP